jgi:predicted nucleic acid-binding protein
MAYLTSEKEANSLQNKMKANMKRSMKNSADILILHTAIKQQIDYLVTDDKDIKKILDSFKQDIITHLQVIDSSAFDRMLPLV